MMNGRSRICWGAALFVLAALLLAAAPALAAPDGVATYRALLIGNSAYKSQDKLESCAHDLAAMKAALTSGLISYQRMSSHANLTQSGIQSAVNGVLSWGADEDDVTVFYYTGHGAASGLVGVEHSSSKKDVYSFSLLESALSNVPGKVIVLLDSCKSGGLIGKSAAGEGSFADNAIAAFSGASGGLSAKAITSGDKFHVIASSSQTQSSWAKTNLYGLTTWALCEAMGWSHNGAKAGNKLNALEGDANGDLTVTVGEAYAYAAGAVSEELKKNNIVQDMKAYPANSGLKLIARSAASEGETSKNATLVKGVLNFSTTCIAPGRTLQLRLNVPGATQVKWGTSKSSIANVDYATGLVTGVKSSSSIVPKISVNYKVGDKWYASDCNVRVLPARYVAQSVKLKYAAKSLQKGASYAMPAKVLPASARYKSLRWESSDKTVATVTAGGKITAVADSGAATITATATSGVAATVTVTAIPAAPKSVRLSDSRMTILKGRTKFLVETVLPAVAADKRVTWKSSRESVATVNPDGQVYAVRPGKAVITCTTVVGGRKATCTVTVAANQSIPRTKPKSVAGQLKASANKIYYNENGMLCVDMFFHNRTGYAQTVPLTERQTLVLRLRGGSQKDVVLTIGERKPVLNKKHVKMTLKVSPDTHSQFKNLDLRGSDAWCEPVN